MAQPVDPVTYRIAGEILPVAQQVPLMNGRGGFGAFSASESGNVVYREGGAIADRKLILVDRDGKSVGPATRAAGIFSNSTPLSRDGKKVAMSIGESGSSAIWIEDLESGLRTRISFVPGQNNTPIWSPDGSRIAFSHALGGGRREIYSKPVNGAGKDERLATTGLNGYLQDWSPDGKWILYRQDGAKAANELWLLPLSGDRQPMLYLETPDADFLAQSFGARFSPDGRWVAYTSSESGEEQVYVQTIPVTGAKWQISTAGGSFPRWRADGKELFYVSGDQRLMGVPIKGGTSFEPGAPQALFELDATALGFEPVHDGQRFLINVPAGGRTSAPPLVVVLNWQAGLKK